VVRVEVRLVAPECARTVAWAGVATCATPRETKPAVATAASFFVVDVFTRAFVPERPVPTRTHLLFLSWRKGIRCKSIGL